MPKIRAPLSRLIYCLRLDTRNILITTRSQHSNSPREHTQAEYRTRSPVHLGVLSSSSSTFPSDLLRPTLMFHFLAVWLWRLVGFILNPVDASQKGHSNACWYVLVRTGCRDTHRTRLGGGRKSWSFLFFFFHFGFIFLCHSHFMKVFTRAHA